MVALLKIGNEFQINVKTFFIDYEEEIAVMPTTDQWGYSNVDYDTLMLFLEDPSSAIELMGKPDLAPVPAGSEAYVISSSNTYFLSNDLGWSLEGQEFVPDIPTEGEIK